MADTLADLMRQVGIEPSAVVASTAAPRPPLRARPGPARPMPRQMRPAEFRANDTRLAPSERTRAYNQVQRRNEHDATTFTDDAMGIGEQPGLAESLAEFTGVPAAYRSGEALHERRYRDAALEGGASLLALGTLGLPGARGRAPVRAPATMPRLPETPTPAPQLRAPRAPDAGRGSATTWYRGTIAGKPLDPGIGDAIWLSDNADIANRYAGDAYLRSRQRGQVYDFPQAQPRNPLVVDMQGEPIMALYERLRRDLGIEGEYNEVLAGVRARGHDAIIVRNVVDQYTPGGRGGQTQMAVLDSSILGAPHVNGRPWTSPDGAGAGGGFTLNSGVNPVPRGRATGADRERQLRRNARILEVEREMRPTPNRSGIGRWTQIDNGYSQIAERLRREGFADVTPSVVKGVVMRQRARATLAPPPPSDGYAETASRLGMSESRVRALSARQQTNAGIPNVARQIAPWLATGGYLTALGIVADAADKPPDPSKSQRNASRKPLFGAAFSYRRH